MQKSRLKQNCEVMLQLLVLIRQNRKWWLFPVWLVLAVLGLFITLGGSGSVLPAIYAVF